MIGAFTMVRYEYLINSKLCMVEEHQTMLIKELKRFGIESIQ